MGLPHDSGRQRRRLVRQRRSDPRWDDEDLATLKRVKVRDFEVVAMGTLVTR